MKPLPVMLLKPIWDVPSQMSHRCPRAASSSEISALGLKIPDIRADNPEVNWFKL
jgi:hypothetical protein